ncbi:beta-glucosidase [Azotobacter salinestris]|uniref:beta-glucosidase n=1 Tax=Azotobacter salinestris TaxID=69964 RepID=UPI0032E03874
MHRPTIFAGFFQGGFECSTHRRHDDLRLDLIAATGHDRHAATDYAIMAAHELFTVRDGARWHLIERSPDQYDWSSFLPMLRAAQDQGLQVIWDICHYGWPDDLDIWRPAFVERFARFAAALARLLRDEGIAEPFYSPVNEISYWAWAGGDQALFNPLARGRGQELKHQLVRANIAAIEAIRTVEPRARFVQIDPVIQVLPSRPADTQAAEAHREAQYEAWDLLTGRAWPGLGGRPEYLDIVGVNYYSDNQWFHGGATIPLGDPAYRPLQGILAEVYQRYRRPVLIAETGAEGEARAPWLRYVAEQAFAAMQRGVPIEGICLYPIQDYPGWFDERHCSTGLIGVPDSQGRRILHSPLQTELRTQQARLSRLLEDPSASHFPS